MDQLTFDQAKHTQTSSTYDFNGITEARAVVDCRIPLEQSEVSSKGKANKQEDFKR